MFTKLGLKNFKAFDDLTISLKPITLLLGPNNSGKSSIIAAIRLLVQTVESSDPTVPLLLNGTMGNLGTYKDIVFGNHRGRPLEIHFSVSDEGELSRIEWNDSKEYWEAQSKKKNITLELAYKFRTQRRELILENTCLKLNDRTLLSTIYSDDSEKQLIEKIGWEVVPPSLKSTLARTLRMHNFIPNTYFFVHSEQGSALHDFLSRGKPEQRFREISFVTRTIIRALQNTDYIGAMRIPPSRLYAFTGERRYKVGAGGEHAANILAMDTRRTGAKSNKVASLVSEWLAKAEIASGFNIFQTTDSFYEIRIKHPKTNEEENLADVGLGNSQILPILVGGYNLSQGSTYLVEEPEIHLHPKAQAELGSFFLDLYNARVQSIIETHSEHLVVRLQQYVADRKISPDDIQVYYVYAQEGKKIVKQLNMDGQGIFTKEWPEGFFPERMEEAKKLAMIRFMKLSSSEKVGIIHSNEGE